MLLIYGVYNSVSSAHRTHTTHGGLFLDVQPSRDLRQEAKESHALVLIEILMNRLEKARVLGKKPRILA